MIHRLRFRIIVLLLAAIALIAIRYRPADTDVAHWGAVSSQRSTALLLVLDPADCLSCNIDLPHWLTLRARNPDGVKILLTRAPTDGEAKAFARFRIPVDGRVAVDPLWRRSRGGTAFLFRDGALVIAGELKYKAIQTLLEQEFDS